MIEGAWAATTGSGRAALEEPIDALGPPRIEPGQHKAWVIGRTAVGTELEQDALVQVAPLPVSRDVNRDGLRDGDPRLFGLFIVDQHGAQDAPRDAIGDRSAGCLVGQSQAGHEAFMRHAAHGRALAGQQCLSLHDDCAYPRRAGLSAARP